MASEAALLVRWPLQLHRAVAKAAKKADLSMAQWMRQAAREKLSRG